MCMRGGVEPWGWLGPSTSVRDLSEIRTSEIRSGPYLSTQDGATQVPRAKGLSLESGVSLSWSPWAVAAFLYLSQLWLMPLESRKGIPRLTCTSPSAPVTQECPWYLGAGGQGLASASSAAGSS